MRRKQTLLAILLLLGVTVPAFAQRFTASLRGTVTDSTGAVLPGATVTVKGTETGLTRTGYSNESGIYIFAELPVGLYELDVELDGFKKAVVSKIELNVADERRLDVQLELGEIVEEITTVASAITVETIGGEVSGLVQGEQIRELPLNGRNFVQLTLLMPGVATPDGFNTKNKGLMTGVDMSVSGSAVTNNLWLVDGANNNDVGSNRTILIYPSVDAIEEFKIHRNAYGAEFGQAAGGQINIVTRGGTNQLSGSVSYFRRDDAWNETNFFLKRAGQPKEPVDRDDINWTLGGAIVKDKLHFFVSQEYNDETRGVVRSGLVPTMAERNGDFSNPIPGCSPPIPVDPVTGEAFPGNQIPSDRLSQAGLLFLQLYPLPNVTPPPGTCNNWVEAVSTPIKYRQDNARLDWSVNDKSRLMVRYTNDDWDNGAPNGGSENGLWGDDPFPAVDSNWKQPAFSFVTQLNQTIGSKAVNTVQYSFSGNAIDITRGGESAGLNNEINAQIPTIFGDKAGGDDVSHPVFWGGQGYQALWHAAPWKNKQDLHVLKDDYQRAFGKHWVKAGALYSQNSKNELIGGASAAEAPAFWGSAGYDGWGATTGNILADFLLEDMTFGFSEIGHSPNSRVRWKDLELYVADSWQLHPRVTLDAGVRYSRYFEPYTEDNNIAGFRPELFDPALGGDPCNGLALPEGNGDACQEAGFLGGTEVQRSLVAADTDNYAPRVGVAWDVFGTGKSALRAGFGRFYQRNRVSTTVESANNAPFIARQSGIRKLDDDAEPCGGCFSVGFGFPARGFAGDFPTPSEWHWNVTWEQQLRPNTTLEVSYVGSRGVDLTRRYDINQVPAGDANGNGVPDRLEYVQASGDGAAQGALRPYSVFGDNTILFWDNDGKSTYNSLQVHFVSRFGRGSHFQASYTWSRSKADDPLTDSGAGTFNGQVTDLSNQDLDYALSGIHRKHVANASLVWFTPSFESSGSFLKNVFGNWQIGTIVLYSTGTPITVYTGTVPGLSDGGSGTGFGGNQRPNRTNAPCRGGGTDISFLNPDAFTLTGFELGTIGTSPRSVCIGPDFFQVDLSLYKDIRITDRFNAQFRIEIFNIFNEVNFLNINNTLSPTSATFDTADQATATRIVDYTIPASFGQATRARDPRQIQLGFRVSW